MKVVILQIAASCLLSLPPLGACQVEETQAPDHNAKEKGDGTAIPKELIPEGLIDASDFTLGEFSKLFVDSLTEKTLTKKFGKPLIRDAADEGHVRLRYAFFNTGRSTGKTGMFVSGLQVFFDSEGRLILASSAESVGG
jgi:hypothetical protein